MVLAKLQMVAAASATVVDMSLQQKRVRRWETLRACGGGAPVIYHRHVAGDVARLLACEGLVDQETAAEAQITARGVTGGVAGFMNKPQQHAARATACTHMRSASSSMAGESPVTMNPAQ